MSQNRKEIRKITRRVRERKFWMKAFGCYKKRSNQTSHDKTIRLVMKYSTKSLKRDELGDVDSKCGQFATAIRCRGWEKGDERTNLERSTEDKKLQALRDANYDVNEGQTTGSNVTNARHGFEVTGGSDVGWHTWLRFRHGKAGKLGPTILFQRRFPTPSPPPTPSLPRTNVRVKTAFSFATSIYLIRWHFLGIFR